MNREPATLANVNGPDLATALTDLAACMGRYVADDLATLVRLRTDGLDRQIRLERTDASGRYATATIPADLGEWAEDGPLTVNAMALAGAVRLIGAHAVKLSVVYAGTGGVPMLQVEGDGVTFRLGVVQRLGWVEEEDLKPLRTITTDLDSATFAVLARAERAASQDYTLPILTATQLTTTGGTYELTAIATDRYRMVEATATTGTRTAAAPLAALLPGGTLALLARLTSRHGPATLAVDDTAILSTRANPAGSPATVSVRFTLPGRTLRVAAVHGEYPRLGALWPADLTAHTAVSVDAALLRTAVERVAWSAGREPMVIESAGRVLLITTSALSGEESATTTVPLLAPTPGFVRVAFNPQFLLDLLATLRHTVKGEHRVDLHVLMAGDRRGSTRPMIATTPDLAVRTLLQPVRLMEDRQS